jgi:hypothetical protein
MSIEAMAWAWDVPVRGTQKLVLLAIADWANADGVAWPHVKKIARRAGVGERAVQDAIADLELHGHIARSPQYRDDGGQRGNLYTLGLDDPPAASRTGGVHDGSGQEPKEEPPAEKKPAKAGKEVEPEVLEVWAHYVRVMKAERQELNTVRVRVIRNALKVRSVAECKRAIDGLRVSPHHNGENDQRQKYLDIRYALKGNSARGESDDERIDKMGELAPSHGLAPSLPRKVAIRLDNFQRYIASGRTREERRSLESKAELEEMGYTVTAIEEAPWVILEKIENVA